MRARSVLAIADTDDAGTITARQEIAMGSKRKEEGGRECARPSSCRLLGRNNHKQTLNRKHTSSLSVPDSRRQSVSASPKAPLDAAVYAALIDSLVRPRTDTLLVSDSTIAFSVPPGGFARLRIQFDSMPPGLP